MKKFVLILLAMMLCCSIAAAETAVTVKPLEDVSVNMIANVNMLTVTKDRLEYLADTDLNILSDGYYSISAAYNSETTLEVREPENGLRGAIGLDGKVIVPTEYDDLEIFNDRWIAGIKLVESSASNYDYESLLGAKKYYLVDSVDIMYCGEKLGTLTRDDYRAGTVYGDYLCIRSRDNKYTFYNKAFEKSPVNVDYSREYEDNRGEVTHNGTGQKAFTAGCTLTPEEVKQSVYYSYYNKNLVDLQGNVLADLSEYDNVYLDADTGLVILTTKDQKKGIMDPTGKVIVECKYDDFDYGYARALKTGWVLAEKDGKAGFVSLKDGTETGFEYRKDAVKQRGWFLQIEDPKSGIILISPLGELPAFFEAEADYNAPYAVVKDTADSGYRLIGLDGKDVIPNQPEVENSYNFNVSYDGSIILVTDKDYNKTLYLVSTAE